MSRTMHHVRWKHWNVKTTRLTTVYRWGIGGVGLDYEDETVGHEMHDLRFYAGCMRVPQRICKAREYYSYTRTWGHHGGAAAGYAHADRKRMRNGERMFSADVAKLYRGGDAVDDVTEPEGRTRHSALWDAI